MGDSLTDLAWPEVAADSLLAVPVGATEQHGPHLSLSTDTDIAIALAHRLAQALPNVVVAPPLAYGCSGEHQDFPGTLSIGRDVTEQVLVELGRSACVSFARTIFVSTHGGNAEPVARAVQRLREEQRAVLAWSPRFGGDAHAGRVETSIILALDPESVRAHDNVVGNPAPLTDLWPLLRSAGVKAASATGVLGDPAGATATQGRQLIDAAGEDLVASVEAWLATG